MSGDIEEFDLYDAPDDPSDRLRDPDVAFVDEELTPEVLETLRRLR